MNGSLAIDAVYAERLSIVSPDEAAMAWLGERYVQELVPGAQRDRGMPCTGWARSFTWSAEGSCRRSGISAGRSPFPTRMSSRWPFISMGQGPIKDLT